MSRVLDFTFRRSRPCLRAMYQRVITAMSPNPGFIGHSQRENRHRAVRWFTSQPEHASNTEPQVTVSVPVDSNNYWYGVLGMSIPVRTMQQF